jgi:hypothetical protein
LEALLIFDGRNGTLLDLRYPNAAGVTSSNAATPGTLT